jgi:hypothetical protein
MKLFSSPLPTGLLVALICALSAGAAEEPPSLADVLKRFRDVPAPTASASEEQSVSNLNMREMSAQLRSWNEAQSQLGNLQSYFDNNDYTSVIRQARQYSRSARSPEIRKLWDDLVSALDAQSKAQAEAYITQVSDLCDSYGKACLAATKAETLDPLMDNVAEIRESRNQRGYSNHPRMQRAHQRLDALSQFLTGWQDYLLYIESGEIDSARNSLRNLMAQTQRYSPVPRSELISRLASLKSPAQAASDDLFKEASLDNLPEIRDRLVLAQESGTRRSDYSYNTIGELDRLISATSALKNGRPEVGRLILRNTNPVSQQWDTISRLRDDWYMRALPALTGLDNLGKPAAGETASAFMQRQLEAALAAENWVAAQTLATLQRDFTPEFVDVRASTAGLDNPAVAINAWRKGQLMEKAAQPYAAAALYREGLKAGAPAVLETRFIARLQTLASEFPDSIKDAR